MKRTIFECNGCGETFGHQTDLLEFQLVRACSKYPKWDSPIVETFHLCVACSNGSIDDVVEAYEMFLVDDGEVKALANEGGEPVFIEDLREKAESGDYGGNIAVIERGIENVEKVIT